MKGKKILVVDDEPDMVEMLKLVLESSSYEALPAYDGQEGVEKARGARPDAIILDLMMPRKDGFQACEGGSCDRRDPRLGPHRHQ